MKKLILLVTGLIISVVVVCAQDAQTKKAESTKTKKAQTTKKEKCNLKNCCMMKDGKMIVMKDGKEMPMTEEVELDNGSKVKTDGTVTAKDGKQWKLKNDDCIDMNGVWGKMPKVKTVEPPKK
jgi:hypothetical protein